MRVLVKLTSKLFLDALCEILRKEKEIELINGESTKKNGSPDLIIVDTNTLSLFAKYKTDKTKIILVDTGLKKDEIISIVMSYKISGILNPGTTVELFKKALKVVKNGQIWIDNETLKSFMKGSDVQKKVIEADFLELEKKVIYYVCRGHPNKEIAKKLFLSEQTVKTILSRIFKKFGVSNRVQLISIFTHRNKISHVN